MLCPLCGLDKAVALSCSVAVLHRGGQPIPVIRAGGERWWPAGRFRCDGCGVAEGGLHHGGCELQACPSCEDPLTSCWCAFDEFRVPDLCDCPPCQARRGPLEITVGSDVDGPLPDLEPLGVDHNGCPVARFMLDGQEVIVHFDDVPESDKAVVDGIPCTTALRTVIDVAADMEIDELRGVIDNCLGRALFTLEEAWERLRAPDMATRPGAERLRRMLPPAA